MQLGAKIAKQLSPGDIVLLEGDLGAGKTTLARAIIRALMADPALEVPSPSFALVQPYENRNVHIIHADLYRLSHEAELNELGLFDDEQAIILIEWPQRGPNLHTRADLRVKLELTDQGAARQASLSFPTGKSHLASKLLAEF